MDVHLLVVPDCPNADAAAGLVRRVLDDLGRLGTPVRVSVIDSQAEAERRGFTGSPTVLIDGADPFAEPGSPAGLACPGVRHPGRACRATDPAALRDALRAAAAGSEGSAR